ncbi:hypothetical protein R1flu_004818 [Riccia fluitans]|uniref:Nodulin-like domain-containing protein n=1 Tax=Riccia fluitans TaxID=41844 RepID=A0ABD1YU92_9MARC
MKDSDMKEMLKFVRRMLEEQMVRGGMRDLDPGVQWLILHIWHILPRSIKLALNYDQKQLDTLAFFKDMGSNVGIVSGMVYEHISPWGALTIGALQAGLGYLMIWLSVTGRVAFPALWQMCLYIIMAANGQTYFNTATVCTCVENFPRSRGIVIGLLKGFLGLSGAILTQLYQAIYPNQPESYILMLSWLPTLALLWMFVLRPVPSPKRSNESMNLYFMSAIALCLVLYLMATIIVQNIVTWTRLASIITCAVCGLVLLLPLGVVYKSQREDEKVDASKPSLSLKDPLLPPPSSSSSSLPVSSPMKDKEAENSRSGGKKVYISESEGEVSETAEEEGTPPERRKPRRGEDHTFFEAVKAADFWLLFVAMACGMGSGLTAIDNMGQIGASQGYSVQKVGAFVSLVSIWNFLGRLGFGTISEICLHRYKIPRPVFLVVTQATMSIGHLMFAVAFPGSLYVGSVVIGLCYGAQWSLMPAITSEIFGLKRFGTLFNTIAIASPLGAYYLSVQVAGRIYDYEAEQEGNVGLWLRDSSELLCDGARCFRLSFIIMAGVSVFGCLVCLMLVARTKRFYKQLVYARVETVRREEEEQPFLA